jgi:hypothetical protein
MSEVECIRAALAEVGMGERVVVNPSPGHEYSFYMQGPGSVPWPEEVDLAIWKAMSICGTPGACLGCYMVNGRHEGYEHCSDCAGCGCDR